MRLMLLVVLSFELLAKSGSGVGNGGTGYTCEVDSNKEEYVTILLDIFEKIDLFYEKDYFRNKFSTHRFFPLPYDYVTQKYVAYHQVAHEIKIDFQYRIELEKQRDLRIFSSKQLGDLIGAKDDILRNYSVMYVPSILDMKEFKTNDTGKKLLPSKRSLIRVGLKNCKFVQIAALEVKSKKGFRITGDFNKIYFFNDSYQYLDRLNYEALLWHELIYKAFGGDDSFEVRKYVRELFIK